MSGKHTQDQSLQETVLEELVQRSFGAQFLYRPIRGKREPFDLAWSLGDMVILFYLTSGSKDLTRQSAHNVNEARGFLRKWSKARPAEYVYGKNRFGDKKLFLYESMQYIFIVSVVEAPVGILVHEVSPGDKNIVVVTINQWLIHELAQVGGTVVDLLAVLLAGLAFSPVPELLPHEVPEEPFREMVAVHTARSIEVPEGMQASLLSYGVDNVEFVRRYIDLQRIPAAAGDAIESKDGRESLAQYFGDYSARDFTHTALIAALALYHTQDQKFTVILGAKGLYHEAVILAALVSSSNFPEQSERALQASQESGGKVLIIYGWPKHIGAEYRLPMLMALPKVSKIPQRIFLANGLLEFWRDKISKP